MEKLILDSITIHKQLLTNFEKIAVSKISSAADVVSDCFLSGHSLYLCGNGGSAADCQHIAGEFVGRFRRERRALPAVALSTDTSVITCIGNDYSYNDIFKRQVEAMVRPGDCLWAFSTSGTSANILAAAELAKTRGAKVLAFTGKADSPLEKMADACVCAASDITSASQEIHQLAYHIICDLVEQKISKA
ncbi:MAG: hypothetical protein A2178_00295 [Planctomycetes bacterium GWC2_49_10]|nr:MAG: hypothetical protein A2178_00295 [Planctomycetes bacterium GWC2_49_10]